MKKLLKNIRLRYMGMVDINIHIKEISNGYILNNKYLPTRDAVQAEVLEIIKNPEVLYRSND